MIKELLKKYNSLIAYLVFGVLTTLINILLYAVCYQGLSLPNVASTVIAWILAVVFAFITNKIWVFNSRDFSFGIFLKEMWRFFAARLITGVIDIVIMFVSVDVMHGSAMIFKIVSNVIVIILNYVLSRLIVFRRS